MQTEYNPYKLCESKYGILGLYIEKLRELKEGKIPTCFETYAHIFEETIPFFPLEKQSAYKAVVEAGLKELAYLRAKGVMTALEDSKSEKERAIDDFLNSHSP